MSLKQHRDRQVHSMCDMHAYGLVFFSRQLMTRVNRCHTNKKILKTSAIDFQIFKVSVIFLQSGFISPKLWLDKIIDKSWTTLLVWLPIKHIWMSKDFLLLQDRPLNWFDQQGRVKAIISLWRESKQLNLYEENHHSYISMNIQLFIWNEKLSCIAVS